MTTHDNVVLSSAYSVSNQSKDVKLNPSGIKTAATKILNSLIEKPYTTSDWSLVPLHPIPSLHPPEEILNFIFLVSCLNFSFWSDLPTPSRFGVRYKTGVDGKESDLDKDGMKVWTGYWSLLAALHRAKDSGIRVEDPRWYKNATEEEIRDVFRSDQQEEMPLLDERIKILRQTGAALCNNYDGQFSNLLLKAKKSALDLVEIVVSTFPSFDDRATYEGQTIYIRKRAQILVAEIWAAFGGQGWGEFTDIDKLTMFADYRVPQILHSLSTLTYSPHLLSTLSSRTLIPSKSPLEIEIRCLSIVAVEEIRLEIVRQGKEKGWDAGKEGVNAVLLDFMLWDQAKRDEEERVAKQAFTMATEGGGGKPHSAVTALIDALCTAKYEEDDYEGIPELVESINLQTTGPTEASRAIRKKLKYSNIHGQLRALTILKALVENGGPRFQSTFANERLVDRIKLMAGDPMTDPDVKKKIMNVLGSWYRQFHDDPKMQLVAGLYASCGGGKKVVTKTAAAEMYENQKAKYEQEAQLRADRKAKERSEAREREAARLAKEKADKERAKKNKAAPLRTRRAPFNFEAEKPKIMAVVGMATQSAQNLINALQRVNRETESVTTNERVVECLAKVKADRKNVVRYIQLVEQDEEGDYIGTLIATNEQIIAALALYDRMSKPVELDSDDEHIEEAKKDAKSKGLSVPEPDGDTASIRSRLSAFELQDSEMERLQLKQRARVEQANRKASIHPDLQDLAFGPSTGSSSLPPPIQPHSAGDEYTHGSLSDYSDYSSSDGELYPPSRGAPPTSASSSSGHALPNTNARSYAQYIQQDDERTGKGKGLLSAGADEDDPFADPFDDGASAYSVLTPGISDKRMEWKEV